MLNILSKSIEKARRLKENKVLENEKLYERFDLFCMAVTTMPHMFTTVTVQDPDDSIDEITDMGRLTEFFISVGGKGIKRCTYLGNESERVYETKELFFDILFDHIMNPNLTVEIWDEYNRDEDLPLLTIEGV